MPAWLLNVCSWCYGKGYETQLQIPGAPVVPCRHCSITVMPAMNAKEIEEKPLARIDAQKWYI